MERNKQLLTRIVVILLALCFVACKPEQPINPDESGSEIVDPGTDPGADPGDPGTDPGTDPADDPSTDPSEDPATPPTPQYNGVPFHAVIDESFSSTTGSEFFDFVYTEPSSQDFRYYPGFPSWNEKRTTLLLLRLDPKAAHGIANGSLIKTKNYTFYGSYSARLRLPDAKAAQPTVGVNVFLGTMDEDPTNGYSQIGFTLKLADPTYAYASVKSGKDATFATLNQFVKDPVADFAPTTSYVTYGFDWHADKLSWWVMNGSEKSVFYEDVQTLPLFPSRFVLSYHYSANSAVEGLPSATKPPLYPYELEVDALNYTPYDDEIEQWYQNYNKN